MAMLPGLGLVAPTSDRSYQPPEPRTVTLEKGSEWRFEVGWNDSIAVKLLSDGNVGVSADGNHDTAELFGQQLAPNHNYDFSGGTKAAIFTYHGCKLSVNGPCESEYVAEETPMNEYLNLHLALEGMRSDVVKERAERSSGAEHAVGPRVLVVGPENAGKSSLIKTLAAYAVRMERSPLVVNLGPKEGMLCVPGSISAAVMGTGTVFDMEDAASGGWGSSPIGGPSAIPVQMPLVYHYGFSGPEERPDLFKPLASRAATVVTGRFMDDEAVREAGVLVDMAGSVTRGSSGYEIISHVVSEFSINVLIVLGSERLFSDMNRRFSPASTISPTDPDHIHVIKLSKSGGCVDRDATYMRILQQQQIRKYFFGTLKSTLSPHTQFVDFSHLSIYRMIDTVNEFGGAKGLDFLPGGGDDEDEADNKDGIGKKGRLFEKITPTLGMQNALLAIKHAEPTESMEAIRDASVMGYLYVADVDESKKKIKVLSPVGGRLPRRAMVWGVWPEGGGDWLVG